MCRECREDETWAMKCEMDEEQNTISTGRLTPCSSDDFSAASVAADAQQAPSRGPIRRRSIFNSYWKKCEECAPSKPTRAGSSGPSYLGVYSFADANLSPTCVSMSLPLSPTSILRRKGSGRAGSLVYPPPLLLDSTTNETSEPVIIDEKQSVHFDPTITVRESLEDSTEERQSRTWYDNHDICRFLSETVVLSQNNQIDAIVSIISSV